MEGNMAGVHLEECVSGFGFGGKWNLRGLSGKKRERKGTFFCHSRIERSWEGLPGEKQKRGEEKNVSERKR